MNLSDQIDVNDPRVIALAKERQQLSHEGMYNPTYDELPAKEQEGACWAALSYLLAAMRAGLVPSDTPPTPDHDRVYVDDEGFLYSDYRTVPAGDEVVRLHWDEESSTSRRELETDHEVKFTHIGWCK